MTIKVKPEINETFKEGKIDINKVFGLNKRWIHDEKDQTFTLMLSHIKGDHSRDLILELDIPKGSDTELG